MSSFIWSIIQHPLANLLQGSVHRVLFFCNTGAQGRTIRVEILSDDGKLVGNGSELVKVPKGAIPYVGVSAYCNKVVHSDDGARSQRWTTIHVPSTAKCTVASVQTVEKMIEERVAAVKAAAESAALAEKQAEDNLERIHGCHTGNTYDADIATFTDRGSDDDEGGRRVPASLAVGDAIFIRRKSNASTGYTVSVVTEPNR